MCSMYDVYCYCVVCGKDGGDVWDLVQQGKVCLQVGVEVEVVVWDLFGVYGQFGIDYGCLVVGELVCGNLCVILVLYEVDVVMVLFDQYVGYVFGCWFVVDGYDWIFVVQVVGIDGVEYQVQCLQLLDQLCIGVGYDEIGDLLFLYQFDDFGGFLCVFVFVGLQQYIEVQLFVGLQGVQL